MRVFSERLQSLFSVYEAEEMIFRTPGIPLISRDPFHLGVYLSSSARRQEV
jgi:hypothetical protein